MPRVMAIGLDAAEHTYLQPLIDSGELPVLADLQSRSRRATLSSDADYRTGIVWEHLLTGRGAEANGRTSVIDFDTQTYDTAAVGARRLTPFYAGVNTVAFDVPYLTLADGTDAAVVTAWGGHDPGYPRASRPAGLLREIDETFGPHPACGNDYTAGWHQPPVLDWLTNALIAGADRRGRIGPWLRRRFPDHELFLTVLSEPHSAGELLWHGVEKSHPLCRPPFGDRARRGMLEVHRAVDGALGRLLADAEPDTAVVVFSLHGMRSNSGDLPSMVLLPELLKRHFTGEPGLRDPDQEAWRRAGCPPVQPDRRIGWLRSMEAASLLESHGPLHRWLRSPGANPILGAALSLRAPLARSARLSRLVARRPIPPETVLGSGAIGEPRTRVGWQIPCWYRHLWPAMQAFALPTFYDGRVRLNLRGRESAGIVDPRDYARTCDDVETLVRECRDARTGGPVVDQVERLRSHDPLAPSGPDADLVITWLDGVDALEHPRIGTIGPFPLRRTGGHSANGFILVSGPGIEPGEAGSRSMHDVTPTILDLLGRPKAGLEGSSLLSPATARR